MGFFIRFCRIAAVETAALSLVMLAVGCAPTAKSFPTMAFDIQAEPDIQRVQTADEKVNPVAAPQMPPRPGQSTERPQPVVRDSSVARTGFPTEPDTQYKDQLTMTATQSQPASHGRVEHVNTDNFKGNVLDADVPVLVDFYADWCGPCRMLAPALDKLARETPDARVVKIDIDKSPQLAARYRVSSIPTVMVFKDGSVVARHTGLADQKTLQRLLSSM
jgi:thioredoxin